MVVPIYLFASFYNKGSKDYLSEMKVILAYLESNSFEICRDCIINFNKNRLVELCDNSSRPHPYKQRILHQFKVIFCMSLGTQKYLKPCLITRCLAFLIMHKC